MALFLLVEYVKKLQKAPLFVKKFVNSGLFDSFFALIGLFFILYSKVPELYTSLYKYLSSDAVWQYLEKLQSNVINEKIEIIFLI